MKVEIKLDENKEETEVLIITNEITEEVNEIYRYISEDMQIKIVGYIKEQRVILKLNDIVKFFSQDGKVYAIASGEEYIVKMRLFNIEEQLSEKEFLRVSNTEIVNLKKVVDLDMSIRGNIVISLKDGVKAYVSRRYIPKIRKRLGV